MGELHGPNFQRLVLVLRFLERPQQLLELVGLLQLAQARCIRRANVDGNVICNRIDQFKALQVVLDRFFNRNDLALSDADAQNAIGLVLGHTLGKRTRTFVVETGAIYQCFIQREPEQTRLLVAGLRMISDGSGFNETKAKGGERLERDSVFIKSSGKSDGSVPPRGRDCVETPEMAITTRKYAESVG